MIDLIFFILGSAIGSFLGVLVDRIPKKENFLTGRSHCDNCKKELGVFDLIPIISFVSLRGKCRYCGKKIPYNTILIEIITGITFVLNYLWFSNHFLTNFNFIWLVLIIYLAIECLLILIFFIDLEHGIIPNKIILILVLLSSIIILTSGISDILNHVISALSSFLFFLLLSLITRGRGMGFGDVKLAFVIGLLLGFPSFILALYLAFLTGAISSIILILWGKKRLRGDTIAFGPFMVIGTLIAIFFSDFLLSRFLPFLIP